MKHSYMSNFFLFMGRQELDVSEAKQKENLLLQSKVQLKLDLQQKYQEERRQHHDEVNVSDIHLISMWSS